MMMRYAILVAATALAVWGVIALSTSSAQVYLVDAGHTGAIGTLATQENVSFWLLATIATVITISLCRFAIFGLPSMVGEWCRGHKAWFYTAIAGGAVYGVLYLM
jgi:hypothetical protein